MKIVEGGKLLIVDERKEVNRLTKDEVMALPNGTPLVKCDPVGKTEVRLKVPGGIVDINRGAYLPFADIGTHLRYQVVDLEITVK